MKYIITISISILLSMVGYSQTSVVAKINYIHGMNGNSHSLIRLQREMNSWNKSQLLYPTEFKQPITHRSLLGIKTAANDVNTSVNGADLNYYTTPRRIVIAHSLGGLVTRQWYNDVKETSGKKAYNGIITLATPHQGTQIAKLLSTPAGRVEFDTDMRDAMNNITEGGKKDEVATAAVLIDRLWLHVTANIVSFVPAVEKLINKLFGNVFETVITKISASDYILSNVAGSERVLQDLASESSVVSEINRKDINASGGTYDNQTYKIAMWGDESGKSVFKMMGTSFYMDNLYDPEYKLQENCDMNLVNKMNQLTVFFNQREAANYNGIEWWAWPARVEAYKEKAKAWDRSATYLDQYFHSLFMIKMGLREVRWSWVATTTIETSMFLEQREVTRYSFEPTVTEYKNDGLVRESSQTGLAGAYKIRLAGINHEEMKVHKEVGSTMKDVFYGNNNYLRMTLPNHHSFYKLFSY